MIVMQQKLRRLAHGLKGNGREFGATEFMNLCKTLEQNAAEGQLEDADDLLDAIEQSFVTVKSALEDYINN